MWERFWDNVVLTTTTKSTLKTDAVESQAPRGITTIRKNLKN
jgi:hypothetical protein